MADAKTRVKEIEIEDYREMLAEGKKPLLVDVREDSEWAAGHAKGAIHIGKGVMERDIERTVPDPTTPMVLYCGGGFRSALASGCAGQDGVYGCDVAERRLAGL